MYLDAAAHLNLHPKAIKAFVEFNGSLAGHGNAQATNAPGRAAAAAIEESRAKIAQLIGANNPNQIIFTSTATQACEWTLFILSQILNIGRVYISPTEHYAIKDKYKDLFDQHTLPISPDGVINASGFDFPDNSAVVCVHVQNEIGIIQPIEKLKSKYVLSDMTQSLGKVNLNISNFQNVTMAVYSGHKFAGPNIGFFYLRDSELWKQLYSGSSYYLDRPGTMDAASIVATAVALEEAVRTFPQRYENMVNFRSVLEGGLEDLGMKIIAKGAERTPSISYIRVPKGRALEIMAHLAENGIYVGLGSACGSLATAGSVPVLMAALGIGGTTNDYIRISQFGDYGAKEAKYVLSKIKVLFPNNNGYI